MNPKLLIDAIVQQTTVLIAQLSTTAGVRAPLSTIADQVFVELARELARQGVSRKVAADMFGLALRTYQAKVQRLEEGVTERSSTLWEMVLEFVEANQGCERRTLLEKFADDDPLSVGAVLKDLCESGLLYRTGTGAAARFRAVPEAEREAVLRAHDEQALSALVRVAIYRGVTSQEGLARRLGADNSVVERALSELLKEGLVHKDAEGRLSTGGMVIPTGAAVGWEAAVFDHYQALVTALSRKLAAGPARSASDDNMGGATVSFELTMDHPLRGEVHGLLRNVRADVNELWERVGQYNRSVERPKASEGSVSGAATADEVVTFYFGQSVQGGSTG